MTNSEVREKKNEDELLQRMVGFGILAYNLYENGEAEGRFDKIERGKVFLWAILCSLTYHVIKSIDSLVLGVWS